MISTAFAAETLYSLFVDVFSSPVGLFLVNTFSFCILSFVLSLNSFLCADTARNSSLDA